MAQRGDLPRFSYWPLNTIPHALDIVWCWFPTEEMPRKPGPKERPALVRAIKLSYQPDRALVEVAYGTSRLKTNERPLDLIIGNAAEMAEAGLPQATRFDLDNSIVLPWAREFFTVREGYRTPVIGHLPPGACMQLEALKVARRVRAARQARTS